MGPIHARWSNRKVSSLTAKDFFPNIGTVLSGIGSDFRGIKGIFGDHGLLERNEEKADRDDQSSTNNTELNFTIK